MARGDREGAGGFCVVAGRASGMAARATPVLGHLNLNGPKSGRSHEGAEEVGIQGLAPLRPGSLRAGGRRPAGVVMLFRSGVH
jgi:hypothetical protein